MADVAADGRTARRDRNRDAVLDAALDLFREDTAVPGLAVVAERSGVSARSVQRYFADMDALVRAALARHIERVAPLFVLVDPGVGPVDERVERLVESRLLLHQTVAPIELDALPAGPRAEVLAALDVLLGFESVEHLREHRGLAEDDTRRVLRRAATALLRPA